MNLGLLIEIIILMSKNASSGFDENQRPDNPQEMLKSNWYFSGLMAGEMSCSVIKRANHNPKGHYYYAIDLTVTNADKALLVEVNRIVMKERGVITPVKGAYNLSARGKDKVQIVLNFLSKYGILVGDLAINRISILKDALSCLNSNKSFQNKSENIEKLRERFRGIKQRSVVDCSFELTTSDRDALGYFLSGILDAEGSFSVKSSGLYKQPFVAVAMKDKKIIETIGQFVGYGKTRLRKDGAYHWEVSNKTVLQKVCDLFLNKYPLHHKRQRERLEKIQQLLNDYTPKFSGTRSLENMI